MALMIKLCYFNNLASQSGADVQHEICNRRKPQECAAWGFNEIRFSKTNTGSQVTMQHVVANLPKHQSRTQLDSISCSSVGGTAVHEPDGQCGNSWGGQHVELSLSETPSWLLCVQPVCHFLDNGSIISAIVLLLTCILVWRIH